MNFESANIQVSLQYSQLKYGNFSKALNTSTKVYVPFKYLFLLSVHFTFDPHLIEGWLF